MKQFMGLWLVMALLGFYGCRAEDDDDDTTTATDITNITLTNRSSSCADYAGTFSSSITDVNNNSSFSGSLTVSGDGSTCTFVTNSIPNHDVNDGSTAFATNVSEVSATYSITASPSDAASVTEVSLGTVNAIFLSGAVVDILPAACYGVGDEPLGQEKTGCSSNSIAWRYDPMYSGNNFGTDTHNAHTQPNGRYHYHGNPNALFASDTESPVIGFAADGYPIFGPYINDGGTVREVTSSYTLRSGTRSLSDLSSDLSEGASPGGTYDGTYRDDYEYVAGQGDLDECNGMTRDGVYGYYVTNTFPWVVKCLKGTPDSSF